jgi:hypothetical protein
MTQTCMSSKLAQRTPQKVKLQFQPWRSLCLAKTLSTIILHCHYGSTKKKMNNHHTEIWESTISYKDAFRANQTGLSQATRPRICGTSAEDLPRGHHIPTSPTSSNIVEEEERRRLPSSTYPNRKTTNTTTSAIRSSPARASTVDY